MEKRKINSDIVGHRERGVGRRAIDLLVRRERGGRALSRCYELNTDFLTSLDLGSWDNEPGNVFRMLRGRLWMNFSGVGEVRYDFLLKCGEVTSDHDRYSTNQSGNSEQGMGRTTGTIESRKGACL